MASSIQGDTHVKYESPYDTVLPLIPPQSPLKRRRSSENDENGEKRQRIEAGGAATINGPISNAILSESFPRPTSATFQYDTQNLSRPVLPALRNVRGFADPHLNMRINSLPILESLSTQILITLAQGPWEDTVKIVTKPETERGQAYTTMKSLLAQTKKIYTQQDIFLSADQLNIEDPTQREIIRLTNLATFGSGVFAGDVGFYELNDHFVETFTSSSTPFSKEHGDLLLSLKTQVYLASLGQEEQDRSNDEMLYEMFPYDMNNILTSHHPGSPLSQTEHGFIEELNKRREYLKAESRDIESTEKLSNLYPWEGFLNIITEYLHKVYEPLLPPRIVEPTPQPPANVTQETKSRNPSDSDGFAEEAEREIQKALQSFLNDSQKKSEFLQPLYNGGANPNHSGYLQPQYAGTPIPQPPDQSAPTQVLYEKARLAAVAKTAPGSTKRPGLPSQRRPWSQEEENALMAGLDLVKGPHWSQILALYGPEGTVNQVLKERNQVQLKDKARNLKLFFLKSNIEVPHYLQSVTGELRTRAPSQAARKEAEKREMLESAEEQERISGIYALNGIKEQVRADGFGSVGDAMSPISERSSSLAPREDESEETSQPVEAEALNADERLRQQLSAHNSGAAQA